MKKIITIALAIIIPLYKILPTTNCISNPDNSNLIKPKEKILIKPANNAKIKYNIFISFAFENPNHFSAKKDI